MAVRMPWLRHSPGKRHAGPLMKLSALNVPGRGSLRTTGDFQVEGCVSVCTLSPNP